VRRGLLPRDDARAMAQWPHSGGFSVDGSVRIEAVDRDVSACRYSRSAARPRATERIRTGSPRLRQT